MAPITTSVLREQHAYTRSREPWRLETTRAAHTETASGLKFGSRLIHYLSGGGFSCFGRTIRQEEVNSQQNRFLAGCGVLAVLWLLAWIF